MFKEIFLDLLKENDLTQAQFSKDTGIPKTTISGWINGNRKPDYYAIQKISEYFKISADDLFKKNNEDVYKYKAEYKGKDTKLKISHYERNNKR